MGVREEGVDGLGTEQAGQSVLRSVDLNEIGGHPVLARSVQGGDAAPPQMVLR